MRLVPFVGLLASVGGFGAAVRAYLWPGTGVDGSIGALLALLGTVSVLFAIGLLMVVRTNLRWWKVLRALAILAAALTALAAWFLMQWGVVAAMVLSLIGLLAVGSGTGRSALA